MNERNMLETAETRIADTVGGPARLQVILVLAAVLALDTADKGTLSAVSDPLKQAFKIGNTEFGLLLSLVSFIGAIGTLPMGVLVDRTRRKTVLIVATVVWAAAMVASGTATSYIYLLITRLFLGAVTAAAWPCVASLTGDFFPARERAGIYGWILAGELVGAGIGFFISGEVSSFASWHWSFYVMAVPTIVLAIVIWRYLPEPARGTQSWLEPGEQDAYAASRPQGKKAADEMSSVQKKISEADIPPRKELILHEDPTRRSLWWAIGYLMKLPTYDLLIAASALAYYFFAGLRTFSMIYFTKHYGLSRGAVSVLVVVVGLGAIVGVVIGGRLSERLLQKGKFNARILVPAVALALSVPFLGAGIWIPTAWVGIPLMTVGAGILAAAIAPIDAARLDIIHPRLWGRGESGRMALRSLFEGGAPLLFGAMSGWLGGDNTGLMWTFLIMLIPMLVASSLAIPARRTYPRDVATAAASVKATAHKK